MLNKNDIQNNIVKDILDICNKASINAIYAVNTELIKRNWLIGKRINDEILTNRSKDYGKHLIKDLSQNLSKYGKGFSTRNLYRYLSFYKAYENILPTLSAKSLLPWTFYVLLIDISNKIERNWYENECIACSWNYRQLERNIKTDYYHRVLSNQIKPKDNKPIIINKNDYLKSIYIFDFLEGKVDSTFKESQLEQSLIDNVKSFMLELGKGYTFKARQFHMRTDNQNYYIDLVFYNEILKCNLLIDLKVGKIQHKDIGQMELYLKMFDFSIKHKTDKASIGMILSSELNEDIVKYITLDNKNHIVSSKYLTYLPTKEQLKKEIEKIYK